MSLLDFPQEILLNIYKQGQSSLKSIRLTCRKLGTAATTILFQHVSISSFRQDRSRFFNIAKTFPDIIRVVTWEEFNGDLNSFNRFSPLEFDDTRALSYFTYLVSGARTVPSFSRFISEVRALFWPEPLSLHSDFLNEFQAAIYKMPGLHTLVYKPMDPRREVTLSSLGSTLTIHTITSMIFTKKEQGCMYSNGFLDFIIPTLKSLANPSSLSMPINKPPTITTVIYTDEDILDSTALTYISRYDAMAFSIIRNLDLCIGGPRCVRADLEGLLTCLSNARKLTSFKLSQEAYMPEDRDDLDDMAIPDSEVPELLSLIPTMPKLTELHLVDLDLRADCQQTSGLIDFIGCHSKTLKRIYLISVGIKKWILPELAAMKVSKLERFVVVSKLNMNTNEDKTEHISEKKAIDYIKGVENAQIPYEQGDRETELRTHDVDTWRKGPF